MYSDAIILVAGADLSDRETILEALGDRSHVIAAQTVEDALAHLADSVDLVIDEIKAGQFNGLELMQKWRARSPQTPFLVLADSRDVSSAVEAMKNGASDCIVKPIDPDELRSAALHLVGTSNGMSRPDTAQNFSNGPHRKSNIDIPPDTSLEDLERAAVEQALIQHRGNRTHAARTLGISVRTLQRKLKAWGMPAVSFQGSSAVKNFVLAAHTGAQHPFSTHAH